MADDLIPIAALSLAFAAIVCVPLGAWIASQKRRSMAEGAALGFLLGPFGVFVELLLPTNPAPSRGDRQPIAKKEIEPPPIGAGTSYVVVFFLAAGLFIAVMIAIFSTSH